MAPAIEITNFTDPACPFAYSAEPHRLKLIWTYGEQLAWKTRMVVLSESPDEYLAKGFTPAKQATALAKLADEHGMPVDAREQPRMMATVVACRAVVAAQLHAPEQHLPLLRRLRILRFSGELIDEPAVIARAARDVGIDPARLERWTAEPEVETTMRESMKAARMPTPAARALDHKLAGPPEERRYTCPSFRFIRLDDARTVDVPGFQPYAAYDVVLANLKPHLERRPPAESAVEVLEWANEPLATAEVAAIRDASRDDARTQLADVAELDPVGGDGFWSLPAQSGRLAA
jgi:predicted DsbA family dithiol-disulfide isomerase